MRFFAGLCVLSVRYSACYRVEAILGFLTQHIQQHRRTLANRWARRTAAAAVHDENILLLLAVQNTEHST